VVVCIDLFDLVIPDLIRNLLGTGRFYKIPDQVWNNGIFIYRRILLNILNLDFTGELACQLL